MYQGNNWYFVTICTNGRRCIFDCVLHDNGVGLKNGDRLITKNGDTVVAATKIVMDWFDNMENIYKNVVLDQLVIMPNHLHFIICFDGTPISKLTKKNVTLGDIIKSFKIHTQKKIVEATTVSPQISDEFPQGFNYYKIWQKSFYDHVIRDEVDLHQVREYIQNNPLQWELDELNPRNDTLEN